MSVRRANGHRLDPVQPRFASWHIYVHRRQPPCVRISPVCARESECRRAGFDAVVKVCCGVD